MKTMTLKQKQAVLVFFGCYDGNIDGIWGPKSVEGTERLQSLLGISEDGIFGQQTEAAARERIGAGEALPEECPDEDFWAGIRYWSREEFRCRCSEYNAQPLCDGFPAEPDRTLVELVDDLRAKAEAPGHRSSGIRCPRHNEASGGVPNSRHLSGKALDFYVEGVSGQALLELALADGRTNYAYRIRDSYGRLTDYIHVDVK